MKLIVAAILFIFPNFSKAQPAKVPLQLRFEHLEENQGLSNNNVTHIFCDSRGFMWFGTDDGLNVYDGTAFSTYRHSIIDTNAIAGNNISSIAEDKNNMLWVGAHCSGLSMLNPFSKKYFNYFADGGAASITSSCDLDIVFDANQNLWVCNRGALSVLNKDYKTFRHFFPFAAKENNLIYRIAIDKNTIWLSHANGVKSFDILTKKFTGYEYLVDSNTCGNIKVIADHKLLVSTWEHGLYIVNPVIGKSIQLLNNITCTDATIVTIAGRKQLWAGTSKGLYVADIDSDILQLKNSDFHLYEHNPADASSLSSDYINCIYFDTLKDRLVWIGTAGGVNKLNPVYLQFKSSVITKNEQPFITTSLYNVFAEKGHNGNSEYWLSYWHGTGLLQTDADFKIKKQIIVKDKNGNSAIVSNAIRGKDGYLWIATWDGLLQYDDKNDKLIKNYKKDSPGKIHLNTNNLDYVLQDKRGRFWLGTYNRDLMMIDMHDSSMHTFNSGTGPKSLIDNRSDFLFEDSKGRIWITGTALQLYNEHTNDFTVYTSKRGDSSSLPGTINSLYEDKTGRLWIASEGGLAWFDELHHTFHTYTSKDGLPNDDCIALTEDDQHNLWVTTSGGLCSISAGNFTISSYTTNEGLPVNQLSQTIFNDGKGHIIFALDQGNSPFISFDAPKLLSNKSIIPFHFSSVTILGAEKTFDQPIETLKALQLSYKQNLFTVSFNALDYQDAAKIRYKCILQGFDKKWIDIGHHNNVTYTNLDGGTYILKVKATNTSGEWLDKELQLIIIIEPPFWKTWWFYIICLSVTALFIYTLFTRRVKKIRKEEAQKTMIAAEMSELKMKALKAQMNPHFVFNSLSSIQESIVTGKTDAAARYLGKFSKLIRMVLEFSEVKSITLQQEIEYLNLYLELEAFRFENFHFNVSVKFNTDIQFLKIPPMLVQPFVENAIKHGLSHKEGDKAIIINFEETIDNFLKVIITDNGIGRQQSAEINAAGKLQHRSMGMKITGDRLQLIQPKNTTLLSVKDITNEAGKPAGTEVTILIPLETTA